jgi:hypothetical protein
VTARTGATVGALLVLLTCACGAGGADHAQQPLHVLRSPFDPRQQTALAFGERSHWLQPWRAYQQTVPATTLTRAAGINFNLSPDQAEKAAALLEAAGVHRVRYEIGWCSVADDDPARLSDPETVGTVLRAFARHHLRPLILLNAHHGCPGPLRRWRARVVAPAARGARELRLDAGSAQQVVPGRSGLDAASRFKAAATLFTAVDGTTVTLSRPLDRSLAPGGYAATTLRYAPFGRVGTPAFERTLSGWLQYVGAVTHEARAVLGGDGFDVEVWNELTLGADFLDVNTYYDPPLEAVDPVATEREILARTIAYLRSPENGVSRVGIGDGFANERPWESGANVPPGLTAIDKHPYAGPTRFPQEAVFDRTRPVDALGRPDGWQDASGRWHDSFIPSYTAFFPEYYLTGIQTEHLVRDLSPIPTDVLGVPHGRDVRPPAGGAAPVLWLTEAGLDPAGVPAGALPRFKAKETLRYLTAWVGRGARAVYLFAAGDAKGPWGLLDMSRPGGGEALTALARLHDTVTDGARLVTRPASVTLAAVGQRGGAAQFAGDGTAAHPPLWDRDVLGFFPFQVSNTKVAVAVYVVSRNLIRSYRPSLPEGDPRRYDLPPQRMRLTIDGVRRLGDEIHATDPLTGRAVPVQVVSRRGNRAVVELGVTDSPRLLIFG